MNTEENNTTTNKGAEQKNNEPEADSLALLAPRYLLPAIVENDEQISWPVGKIAAGIAILVVLAGLIALYIHGGNIAVGM